MWCAAKLQYQRVVLAGGLVRWGVSTAAGPGFAVLQRQFQLMTQTLESGVLVPWQMATIAFCAIKVFLGSSREPGMKNNVRSGSDQLKSDVSSSASFPKTASSSSRTTA